jgi:hypothetical protein
MGFPFCLQNDEREKNGNFSNGSFSFILEPLPVVRSCVFLTERDVYLVWWYVSYCRYYFIF